MRPSGLQRTIDNGTEHPWNTTHDTRNNYHHVTLGTGLTETGSQQQLSTSTVGSDLQWYSYYWIMGKYNTLTNTLSYHSRSIIILGKWRNLRHTLHRAARKPTITKKKYRHYMSNLHNHTDAPYARRQFWTVHCNAQHAIPAYAVNVVVSRNSQTAHTLPHVTGVPNAYTE